MDPPLRWLPDDDDSQWRSNGRSGQRFVFSINKLCNLSFLKSLFKIVWPKTNSVIHQDIIRLMCFGSEMTITPNLVIYIEIVEQKAQIKQTCLLDNAELCV